MDALEDHKVFVLAEGAGKECGGAPRGEVWVRLREQRSDLRGSCLWSTLTESVPSILDGRTRTRVGDAQFFRCVVLFPEVAGPAAGHEVLKLKLSSPRGWEDVIDPVSYTHLRAHETGR